jgi:hypothetical protein
MDIFKADNDVVEMANEVIKQYRPELLTADIVYIFKEKAKKRGGKIVIATASKVSDKQNIIHSHEGKPSYEFMIEIGADAWLSLSPDQKRAVLHHELRHCGYKEKDEEMIPIIIPHDLEEFSDVVEAHGFYLRDVLDFANKIRNMKVTDTNE